jgi:hypothetical protein
MTTSWYYNTICIAITSAQNLNLLKSILGLIKFITTLLSSYAASSILNIDIVPQGYFACCISIFLEN